MRNVYDPAVAQLILDRMSEGEAMDSICADNQMPPRRIVRRWLHSVPEFRAQYELARELQGESISDRIIAIEKQVLAGELDPKCAKVAIDSMQFRIARLAPKRWGTKVETHVQMHADPRDLTDAQLAAFIAGSADAGIGVAGAAGSSPVSRKSH